VLLNVAAVPVMIKSVEATPVNPLPSPLKLPAVRIPVTFKLESVVPPVTVSVPLVV